MKLDERELDEMVVSDVIILIIELIEWVFSICFDFCDLNEVIC